jgi:hypothetical protein
MQASSESSRASGDAIVLEMQQPYHQDMTGSYATNQPMTPAAAGAASAAAAAVCAHGIDTSSMHVQAVGGCSDHLEGSSKDEPSAASLQQLSSIYEVFSRRQRGLILAVVSVSQFLNPFSSSIILPSLKVGANPFV